MFILRYILCNFSFRLIYGMWLWLSMDLKPFGRKSSAIERNFLLNNEVYHKTMIIIAQTRWAIRFITLLHSFYILTGSNQYVGMVPKWCPQKFLGMLTGQSNEISPPWATNKDSWTVKKFQIVLWIYISICLILLYQNLCSCCCFLSQKFIYFHVCCFCLE